MLHIINTGASDDVLGEMTRSNLAANGIDCAVYNILSGRLAKYLLNSNIKGKCFLCEQGPVRWEWRNISRGFQPLDVVWVVNFVSPRPDVHCRFERVIPQRGAKYFLFLLDNMLAVPYFHDAIVSRIQMAECTSGITEDLREQVVHACPEVHVELLEEPVNTERLYRPKQVMQNSMPVIIWTGQPRNLHHIMDLASILEAVYAKNNFILRLVCGQKRPCLDLHIPWEWHPYNPLREGDYYRDACAGIAYFADTPYNKSKGNYKVKTMLAAGVPVVTNPIGYNLSLVKDGQSGFLAKSETDWVNALCRLLSQGQLAAQMGQFAHADMKARYSHQVLMPIWSQRLRTLFPDSFKS